MATETIYNTLTSFVNQPAGVAATDITIQLLDVGLFPVPGLYYRVVIDSEIMQVTGNVAGLLTVVRGMEATVATAHLNNAPVSIQVTAGALLAVFVAI